MESTSETTPIGNLYQMWDLLADVPTNEDDTLAQEFLSFEVGTPREDVWRWFESQNPKFVVGDVMRGIRIEEPQPQGAATGAAGLPRPPRMKFRPETARFEALLFFPARSPAQAVSNEWVIQKVRELPGLGFTSIVAKAHLEIFAEMSAVDREQYVQKFIDSVDEHDPFHPQNLLMQISVDGQAIYGTESDLMQICSLAGIDTLALEPVTLEGETPAERSRFGSDV